MTAQQSSPENIIEEFQKEHAGVLELLEMYEQIEEAYIAAYKHSAETEVSTSSNSTNIG